MISFIGIFVFLVVIGANFWLGLWNNILTLVNFFIAAMVASAYYENMANLLADKMPSYAFVLDFLALWLLFFVTLLILRAITGALTSVQLKLNFWVDMVGRGIACTWLAGAFTMFTLFSIHLAPIPPSEEVFSNYDASLSTAEYAAQGGDGRSFMGLGPGRIWMAFIQSRSRGAMAASQNSLIGGEYDLQMHPDDADLVCRVFDPRGRMPLRREHIANVLASREKMRLDVK